jgi:AcrR family transcriptional regulator
MARKRNQDARRRELLHAAVSVINERGPAGVQMKDVARAANMATGSVYYYYDGVEELLRHVHRMAFERYLTHRRERFRRWRTPSTAGDHGRARSPGAQGRAARAGALP